MGILYIKELQTKELLKDMTHYIGKTKGFVKFFTFFEYFWAVLIVHD